MARNTFHQIRSLKAPSSLPLNSSRDGDHQLIITTAVRACGTFPDSLTHSIDGHRGKAWCKLQALLGGLCLLVQFWERTTSLGAWEVAEPGQEGWVHWSGALLGRIFQPCSQVSVEDSTNPATCLSLTLLFAATLSCELRGKRFRIKYTYIFRVVLTKAANGEFDKQNV